MITAEKANDLAISCRNTLADKLDQIETAIVMQCKKGKTWLDIPIAIKGRHFADVYLTLKQLGYTLAKEDKATDEFVAKAPEEMFNIWINWNDNSKRSE